MSKLVGVQGITEQDIAEFLANHPSFFERQAELLSSIQLRSPHGNRAVSLQERQMEMLRERIKGLELKLVEMIRNGQENVAIADRLHHWMQRLLATSDATQLPAVLTEELQHRFLIPQVALRLWGLPADARQSLQDQPCVSEVSGDVKSFAASLSAPFCGGNHGFEAAQWLGESGTVLSLAMIPVRQGEEAFGLLVLGSPDPTRYSADMGTEFLARIGDVASAALARLRQA
jgi:uncharacterized protein YigA (DUF484 family)